MSKKLISMLTVMAMMMTMLSGAALAVSEDTGITNEARLNAAIEAAEEGTTITLEGDIELTEKLTISKEITIDLNGFNIDADFEDDGYGAIYVGVNGDLTITGNGIVTSANATTIGNYGVLTVDCATVECADDENYAAIYNFYYNGTTYGKTTLKRGSYVNGNFWNCGELYVEDAMINYVDNSGYMAAENAEIEFLYGATGEDASEVANCGTIDFVSGTIILGDAILNKAITIDSEVDVIFFGEICFENDTNGDGVFHVIAGGDLTLGGGGTIDAMSDGNNYDMAIWADGGDVIINGGTYTNVGAGDDTHYDLIYAGSRAGNGGTVTINGGTFIAHTTKWTLNTNDSNGTITVKGGTFYKYNPSEVYTEPTQPKNFVAEGYEAKADGEYYVVSPSAETAFRQAIAEGGNVTLTENLCITAPIVVDKTVTLDMNGFKIYNEADIWDVADKEWSLISVQGGDLTITGEGTFDAKENDCYAIDVRNGGTLTIENGTVIGNVSAVYVLEGTANIEGGEYSIKQKSTFDDERYTLNCLDANFRAGTADINVTGGTFNKYNPAISNSENPEAVFVAEGYEAKQDGEYYVVSAIVIPEPPAPPVEDDDDDYTPVVKNETTAKDENGKAIETEKQADGSVVVDAGEGDQFTVDTPKGEDATVVIETEGKNYGLVAVIVNEDGTETVITDTIPTENGIQFTVKDGQTVKIVDNSQIFDDVKEGDWNHDAVTFAAARGIVNGVGDGKFEPTAAATRGMVMTMLARLSGEDTTGGENWYAKGMEWARENGISDGTNPTAEISREQLIVMLWRLEGSPKANGVLNGFDDATDVSGWASDAMAWAVEKGLVQGNNGQLMPENNANRDQVAQILMNYILM